MFHSVLVDESYSQVGKHIDSQIRRRIVEGEFIDFARLLPRDRVLAQQESRLEIFLNNGQPGFCTINETDVINNFFKWEQAFRVFSTIYADVHPEKAKQLIQYNHIIYSASLTFTWSNVYAYDIDFRLHMAENPGRNWGIILQQTWMIHMKEKIGSNPRVNGNNNGGNSQNQSKRGNGKIVGNTTGESVPMVSTISLNIVVEFVTNMDMGPIFVKRGKDIHKMERNPISMREKMITHIMERREDAGDKTGFMLNYIELDVL